MKLTLSLVQINTKLGDVQANLEKHLALAKQARQDGIDLLVFPELSLTGYALQDLVPTVACRAEQDDPVFRPLLKASQNIDLVIGFVDEDIVSVAGPAIVSPVIGLRAPLSPKPCCTLSTWRLYQSPRKSQRIPPWRVSSR
jgi:predicted amidohydrolase